MLPKELQTEAVDGGDPRMVDQAGLALQVPVPWLLLQPLFQGIPDPLPHLCRRRIGKGHDQKPVNVHRMVRVRHHADDPFHQHRRLSAARCR